MATENLAVVSLLADMGNGEVQNATTDLPLVNGQDASISTPGRMVHWDAEWHWDATYTNYAHQALGGHIVCLGLTSAQQIWQEYTYPIFQWAHQQNALAGFAHLQYLGTGFPQDLNCCLPIEYPVEVALGDCDFLDEDVTGGDPAMQAYYRLLNCGFRPGFAGGSDYPCGQNTIGAVLTYVKVPGTLTYRGWINGIAAGRTVVSRNGHAEFLALTVSGTASPGDEIKLSGPGTVQVSVQWTAAQSLDGTVEIVCNGVVVASQSAAVTPSSPVTLSTSIDFPQSGWIAARRMGTSGHAVQTGAVFVTVNGAPVRASVDDANFYVSWMDNLLANTAPGAVWSSYFITEGNAARARYQAARTVYAQIAAEAGGVQPFAITTTSLPSGVVNLAYTAALAASGGLSPYTWSVVNGSIPAGLTLNNSTGAITGTPITIGTSSFTVQANDSSNPAQTVTQPLSIAITTMPTTATIWPATAIPILADGGPDSSVEIGVKFRSDVAGQVTGIRFYKAATNTGTHIGDLWTLSGTKLATATFAGETASGWQQVNFPTPVSIVPNTVYIASYHCTSGHYSADLGYFGTVGVDNTPLHALADGASGPNGVYAYGANSVLPTLGWNASNYWVDLTFMSGSAPTLNSISLTPSNPTLSAGATQQFNATGSYSDGSTQNVTGQAQWNSSKPAVATIGAGGLATAIAPGVTSVSASLSGVNSSTQLTVQASPLAITTTALPGGAVNVAYSATLAATGGLPPYGWSLASGSLPGGLALSSTTGIISGVPTVTGTFAATVQVRDSSNPVVTATAPLAIVIAAQSTTVTIWPGTTVPGTVDGGADSSVELGVRFISDVSGSIAGVRFYKAAANTGTHVGHLWTNAGALLATGTFSGETASGWQQVVFPAPVAISANTLYVASYSCASGHYSADLNYFTANAGVDTPPLHIPANSAASGSNGLYAYGATTAFPTKTWDSCNYWVDVMLNAATTTGTATKLFADTAVPGTVDAGPDNSVELGVRFQSDVAGRIAGIRFYKASLNSGTHTGSLWSSTGTLLASGTFTGESASGWQQMTFSTPVTIAANTIYVASYHCGAGHYSDNTGFFATGLNTPPLHAPADGTGGFNGVYQYGTSSAFPSLGWSSSNYWVDVVFQATQ